MREIGLSEVIPASAHLFIGERVGSRHPVAVHAAAVPARTDPVLHGLDLHVVPVLRKCIVDTAVVAELAVEVSKTFPDTNGGKMLRLHARDLPLIDGVVGDAT